MIIPIFTIFAAVVFSISFLLNFVPKKSVVVYIAIQSLIVAVALYVLAFSLHEFWLVCTGVLILIGKAMLTPILLRQAIRERSDMELPSSLKTPLSLLILASITIFSVSFLAPHIPRIINDSGIPLLFASFFITLFFIANRYSTLAIVVGIVSLENSLLLLFLYLGFSPLILLLAVSLDLIMWILTSFSTWKIPLSYIKRA